MTTEQGSRIIAEFMELKADDEYGGRYNYPYGKHRGYCMHDKLKFHKSWSWFMPAWFKFRDLEFTDDTNYILHQEHKIHISAAILNSKDGTPLEAFTLLVDGIEWYESIKK